MSADAATSGARGINFVLVVVFVDMLGASVAIPVLPPLVLSLVHGRSAAAADAVGLFGTAFSAMQLLFGPLQGALGDRFGRRAVLVLSCLGLSLSQVGMAIGEDVGMLLVARLLAGAAAANLSTAAAYVADVTPAEQRAAAFGKIGVAFGSGFVFGPLAGGLLAGISLRAPFWFAAGLSLANALWAVFSVTESLRPELRRRFRFAQANPLGALGMLVSDRRLTGLSVATLISLTAQQALITVFMLSGRLRYGWSAGALGLAMGAVGLSYAIVGGALIKPVVERFGERRALLAGIGFGIGGFMLMAVAPDGIAYAAAIPLISLWGLASPATQGAITRIVSADEQGRLQGAMTALAGLAGIVGPGMFAGSLAFALRQHGALHVPGLPFVIAAGLLAVSGPIAWRATRTR